MHWTRGFHSGRDREAGESMDQRDNGRSILKVSGLKTYFFTSEGVIKAVDGVDF